MIKRIYIVSYYFPPLGRATGVLQAYFAKHIAELGWDVCALTTGTYAPVLFGGQRDSSLLDVLPRNIRILRASDHLGAQCGPFFSSLHLWDSQFKGWRKSASKKLDVFYEGPGIVYATVPPRDNALVAYEFSQKYKLPLVLDFKDDYFDLPSHIVNYAKLILASTPISLDNMTNAYNFPRERAFVFYNGTCGKINISVSDKFNARDVVHFVFSGTINPTTRPEILADAGRLLKHRFPEHFERVRISIFGSKSYYYYLVLKRHLSKHVTYRGFIPSYAQLLNYLAENADVGVCSFNENWKYGISSKTFTYMAAGLPILAYGPEGGALQQFVESNGIGLFSPIGDIETLMQNIARMTTDIQMRECMASNVRNISSHYTMEAQVRRIEPHFSKLL